MGIHNTHLAITARTKCGYTTQNPYTKNKQLHETKAPNQKYAIITRNPQQCANRKPRDPRNLQVPITGIKTFQAPQQHCNGSTSSEEETNKSAQERKKERTEKRGKKAALVVLSHIVSPQRFGTWSIYILLVDTELTYLGGVDRWSRWPMA